MRALKRAQEIPSRLTGPFESLLAQFSAATLELNPSLSTPEFSRRLIDRASAMLGARSAVLALRTNSGWELVAAAGRERASDRYLRRVLANAIKQRASALSRGIHCGSCDLLLGFEAAGILGCEKIYLVPLHDSEGIPLAVLCLGDLSREMSSTEEQLLEALAGHASVALENAELFHRVEQSRKQWVGDFDAISDFIVVHDADNRVLRLNRTLADRLQLRVTDALGRDMSDLRILGAVAAPRCCPFCPDSDANWQEIIHQAGDRTYIVSSSRVGGDGGQEVRTIHVLKDITDRLEAERRYRRERDFNRNILNSTLSMILVLDTEGLIGYANRRCAESGYPDESLLRRSLAEMIPPSHRKVWTEAFQRTQHGLTVDNLEIPLHRPDGVQRQFALSLSPMPDEWGAISRIVAVMTDITDAIELQGKLMQTEKMAALGQLVSGVAHEVNNPLAAIVGFTDLLLENPAVPVNAKEELRVILAEAERTRLIVHNLLSFARQTPPRREGLQVNAVLRRTLKLRAYDFSSHGVDLREDYADDLPVILGDAHQLQQVFLNIVNNAYDAVRDTGRPGSIAVSTAHREGHLEITFRDNGTGISRPDRIFDPFFTTKEVGKGTGLGLSICYGIVRAHRGEIVARNNADGDGCTFIVRLPAQTNELLTLESET